MQTLVPDIVLSFLKVKWQKFKTCWAVKQSLIF